MLGLAGKVSELLALNEPPADLLSVFRRSGAEVGGGDGKQWLSKPGASCYYAEGARA